MHSTRFNFEYIFICMYKFAKKISPVQKKMSQLKFPKIYEAN